MKPVASLKTKFFSVRSFLNNMMIHFYVMPFTAFTAYNFPNYKSMSTSCSDLLSECFFLNCLAVNCVVQKQPPELFCEKGVLRNLAKFTGKDLRQNLIFGTGVFPRILRNIHTFLTPFITEHLR